MENTTGEQSVATLWSAVIFLERADSSALFAYGYYFTPNQESGDKAPHSKEGLLLAQAQGSAERNKIQCCR